MLCKLSLWSVALYKVHSFYLISSRLLLKSENNTNKKRAIAKFLRSQREMSGSLFSEIIGWTATGGCFIQMSSAAQVSYGIYRAKCSGPIDPNAFLAQIVNCFIWTLYGIIVNSMPVCFSNGLGVITGIVFCGFYMKYGTAEQRKSIRLRLGVTAFAVALMLVLALTVPVAVLGIFGAVFAVSMFFLPTREIYRTRSTACISVMFNICGLVVGLLWVIYGATRGDWYIMSPNIINSTLTAIVLCIWVYEFKLGKKLPGAPAAGCATLPSEKSDAAPPAAVVSSVAPVDPSKPPPLPLSDTVGT